MPLYLTADSQTPAPQHLSSSAAAAGFLREGTEGAAISLHHHRYYPACERDLQCGVGSCCAISLWLRGLRMCTPMGQEGEECHPFSHKVPFHGKRLHHTCPCVPSLVCSKILNGKYRCSIDFKNMDFQ
ncbi:prokineticin-1 [Phyllobates terribilis]|uniref:prokineticin-1 n=1 Tax=Phyllobates terribilis TaxID=111132 RepID=UPI003CCB1454